MEPTKVREEECDPTIFGRDDDEDLPRVTVLPAAPDQIAGLKLMVTHASPNLHEIVPAEAASTLERRADNDVRADHGIIA